MTRVLGVLWAEQPRVQEISESKTETWKKPSQQRQPEFAGQLSFQRTRDRPGDNSTDVEDRRALEQRQIKRHPNYHKTPVLPSGRRAKNVFFVVRVLVAEAAASVPIHNYDAVQDKAQVDAWRAAHLQWMPAWENTDMSGPLLKQALRYISELWRRTMLLCKTPELVLDPGPATFVSSCAIFTLCLVQFMQHKSHHRYQNTFLFWGAVCGLILGAPGGFQKARITTAFTTYLPASIIAAQLLSLILHSLHSSWRHPDLCENESSDRVINSEYEKAAVGE